jgi:hypothetical protein
MPKSTPRKKCMDTAQKLARLAAANDNGYCQCVSCGNWYPWQEMHGGHYIAKGHSSYWALRKENLHPQCLPCNNYGMRFGTAAQEYTKWMIDYYGRDFVDQMERDKKKPIKFYKKDYEKMTREMEEEIKFHLERIA